MATKTEIYFEDRFFGMDRRIDPDKLADGFCPLCVNVDLDRLGTVRKRRGNMLLGEAGIPDAIVQSLVTYVNKSGVSELHMVRNSTLYKYDSTADSWAILSSGIFPSLNPVVSTQFKNAIYHTSATESLRKNEGGSITDIVGGTDNPISGKCLAVGQRTLFIGNVTWGGVSYPDRVYYSLFDTETNQETDQFWAVDETGLADSTNFFRVEGGVVRAIVSYASRNRTYIFSDTKCYVFDINQVLTNRFNALNEVFQVGCAGPRAITVSDNVMYWMDQNAKIWAWGGASARPEEISYPVDDTGLGNSIISAIKKDSDNLSKICAFSFGKKLYFSVGNLNIDDKVLPNAVIKISLSQDGFQANYSIDTYPDRILCAQNVRLNDEVINVVGNSNNVLRLNYGLNDVKSDGTSVAVNSYYRTRFNDFGLPFQDKKVSAILVRYKPQPVENTFLNLAVAINGNNDYEPISKPINEVKPHGDIDMYGPTYQTKFQGTRRVLLPNDAKGRNISLEFSNTQLNESFEIQCVGFESTDVDIISVPNA